MKKLLMIAAAALLLASCIHRSANITSATSGKVIAITEDGIIYRDTDVIGNEKGGIIIARGKETVYDYTDAKSILNREALKTMQASPLTSTK